MISVVCWGAAIAAFGLSTTVWATLLFLAIAGGADMVSGIYRDAVLKTTTPDEMRGRLEGVSLTVVAAGPSLGDLEAGAVASRHERAVLDRVGRTRVHRRRRRASGEDPRARAV